MKLSILIPITPERYDVVQPLLNLIIGQTRWMSIDNVINSYWEGRFQSAKYDDVEVCMISDEKQMTLGEKRERLYKMAEGEYSWQVDSDDLIAEDAIELILSAIDNKSDCITFQERCDIEGSLYKSNFSNKYQQWEGGGNSELSDGFHFHRTVFYKCVIKTEIARKVPFKHIRFGEDFEWAIDLKPHINTEIHIDKELYYYIYEGTPHNERYGIK